MSLVDKILAEMQKEPELAVLNRPPLRTVQPSSDKQSSMRLHFGKFDCRDFAV